MSLELKPRLKIYEPPSDDESLGFAELLWWVAYWLRLLLILGTAASVVWVFAELWPE